MASSFIIDGLAEIIGDIPCNINKEEILEIDYEKYLKNISNPLDIRKIDYKTKPVFAIIFAKTDDINEIKNILKLNMSDFIIRKNADSFDIIWMTISNY